MNPLFFKFWKNYGMAVKKICFSRFCVLYFGKYLETRTKEADFYSIERTLAITQPRSRNAQDRDNHERFARMAAGRRRGDGVL